MYLISWIALPNVWLQVLHVLFESWQMLGHEFPASWRCTLCPCNVVIGTSLEHFWLSTGMLWALFREVACLSNVSSITARTWDLIGDFGSLQGWVGVLNVNQVGSQWILALCGQNFANLHYFNPISALAFSWPTWKTNSFKPCRVRKISASADAVKIGKD